MRNFAVRRVATRAVRPHCLYQQRQRKVHLPRPSLPFLHSARGDNLKVPTAMPDRGIELPPDNDVTEALKYIDSYCQRLPQDSDEALECWEAYNYVDFESGVANRECMLDNLEKDMKEQQCSNFLEWENFLRRLEALGGAKYMVETIHTVRKAEENRRLGKETEVEIADLPEEKELKMMCQKLFDAKDSNKDGKLNVEEFRSLMKDLGHEVHGEQIIVMFQAMDIHGSLDFDEFYTILEAETFRSPESEILRTAARHGHYGDKPKWLDMI